MNEIQPMEQEAIGLKYFYTKFEIKNDCAVLMDVSLNTLNHFDVINFYRKIVKQNYSVNIPLYRYLKEIQNEPLIICAQSEKIDSLLVKYKKIDSINNCYLLQHY